RLLRKAAAANAIEDDQVAREEDGLPRALSTVEDASPRREAQAACAKALIEMLTQPAAAFVLAAEAHEGGADAEHALAMAAERATLREAWQVLSGDEREVVAGIVVRGMRQEELAGKLGVSRSTISRTLNVALATLRDELK